MISLHKPTPVDSQEEAAASQSAAAIANGALPGSFQAPAGFVLKGLLCHVSRVCLCERMQPASDELYWVGAQKRWGIMPCAELC